MKADPAGAAAKGVVSQSGAGYFAMVCVYLVGPFALSTSDLLLIKITSMDSSTV